LSTVLSLRTVGFRNLADAETAAPGKDIFLVGENGQGKTNFLEALYFCSYASSFRGVRDSELVRSGEKDCAVSLKSDSVLHSDIAVTCKAGKKTVLIDGKKIEDRKELLSACPAIVFCHEDMEFVSGSPERRRWFFDQSLSLYDPLYVDDLRRYKQVLKTRNALLKDGGNLSLLDAIDPQLAQYGLLLMEKRSQAAEKFSFVFEPLFREVTGIDGVVVRYAPSWKEPSLEALVGLLAQRREGDLFHALTLSGPHRDRYLFSRKGLDFSGRASTGQRRLLALLLRVSQAQRFSEMTGQRPVLLLDDVLLELDGEKRKRFLENMPSYDQAFFTFLPGEPYQAYRKPDTVVYTVEGGALTPA
jgi:DNA replication and repair protein RecF